MDPKVTNAELELVPSGALESITRGEIDIQIATAHKYPRSMAVFKARAIDMATIDQATAESCIYVRPVGMKNGQQQYAEGLSVRMAEIVGASYGNLRVGSMIIEQTERYVVVRGYAHDLETNFASTSEVKEPTVKRDGAPYGEAQRAVVAKAALSKARRDATFQVVPKALCRPVEIAARALIAGDAKSMDDRRAAAVQYVQRLNIDPLRIWKALGIVGPDDLNNETLLTLTGIRNAIKDGDSTIDDAFPPIIAQGKVGQPAATADPGQTPSEQAAAASTPAPAPAQAETKPVATAPASSAPSAAELCKQLLAKGAAINAGKVKIANTLIAMGVGKEGQELKDMTAGQLATAIDGWAEVEDKIKNPEAE